MSAYIVPKTHIDALVTAIEATNHNHSDPLSYYWPEITESDTYQQAAAKYHRVALSDHTALDVLGQMLWAENLASINYRYPDTITNHENIPGPIDFRPEDVPTYRYDRLPGRPDPVMVLDAIHGYEYQACEHPGWRTSEARTVCEALRSKMIQWIVDGTGRGAWEIDNRQVFVSGKALAH